MPAKTLMIQGTASSVGKTVITAALCRLFSRRGVRVAPFKAQNMSRYSCFTREGLEISRAQAMQAEAAGIVPDARMNPILLKPCSDTGSQVIVHGQVRGNMSAQDYYTFRPGLRKDVLAAFASLAEEYDLIIMEGAGSPAEINLAENDLVNMGMAAMADAPVLLAGDIERGGVFAALYGTVRLLPPEDQARIKGLIINRFRGDIGILEPGLRQLEDLLRVPVLGVLPYTPVDLEEEDSLSERLAPAPDAPAMDRAARNHAAYEHLADLLERHLDMGAVERIIGL